MDCERIAPLLSAHLDGELDPAEGRTVRRHLFEDGDGCECAALLESLRNTRATMRAVRPGTSGRGLDEVLARIRREGEPAAPAPVVLLRRPERSAARSDPRSHPRAGRRLTAGLAAGLAAALLAAVLIAPLLGPEGADPPGAETPAVAVPRPPLPPAVPATTADEGPPACLRPEECGSDGRVLWPAVPI